MNPNQPQDSHTTDYAPYPTIDPNDVAPAPATSTGDNWTSVPVGTQPPPPPPPPPSSATAQPVYTGAARSSEGVNPSGGATTIPSESNPYVSPAPVPESSTKKTIDSVKDVLGKWGKKAADATKKGQDYAGEVWQHCGNETRLIAAATKQLYTLPFYHSFWNSTTKPSLDLAKELLGMITANKMSKAFFTNSGSDANDTQVKLVWYYNNALGRPNKKKIIARTKSYHGSTLVSASLSGYGLLKNLFLARVKPIYNQEIVIA